MIFLCGLLVAFAAFFVFAVLCALCLSGQIDEIEERTRSQANMERRTRGEANDCVEQRKE